MMIMKTTRTRLLLLIPRQQTKKRFVQKTLTLMDGLHSACLAFVPEADRVKLIEPGSISDDTNINGRKEQRKKKKNADDEQRERDGNNQRGLTFQQKIAITTLDMKAEDIKAQHKDRSLMALNCTLQSVRHDLNRAETRAYKFCEDYDKK